jgi:hypothetical protein
MPQMLQETEHKMISLKQLEEKLRGQSQVCSGQCVNIKFSCDRALHLLSISVLFCPQPYTKACLCAHACMGLQKALHLLFGQWHKDYFMNKSPEELELEQYFLA